MVKNVSQEKLRALQEFKSEYGVGGLHAWKYMKVRQDYEEVKDNVLANLQPRKNFEVVPSVRNVSNLCNHVQHFASRVMTSLADERSEEIDSECDRRYQLLTLPSDELSMELGYSESEGDIFWQFDYTSFITRFYNHFQLERDSSKAYKQAFTDFMESGHEYLRYGERNLTFREFLADDTLLLRLGENIDPSLYGEIQLRRELSKDPKETFIDFSEWVVGKDYPHQYKNRDSADRFLEDIFGKWKEQGFEPLETKFCFGDINPEETTYEEKVFLQGRYEDHIYLRAERERTLNRLEIERRIALNEMASFLEDLPFESRFAHHIDSLQMRLSMSRWGDHSDSGSIPYTMGVLKRHKSWLEKVLAN